MLLIISQIDLNPEENGSNDVLTGSQSRPDEVRPALSKANANRISVAVSLAPSPEACPKR
jgi:hypothetical protein